MFKFIVLSVLVCAAVAEPGVFLAPSTYAAPFTSTYVQYSNAICPADVPSVYSSLSYPHFIKKREAQFYNNYFTNGAYIAPAALATPYASTLVAPAGYPATYSAAVLPYAAPAHFIKKRSASASPALLSAPLTSYVAPAPLASTYIASAPLAATYSAPFYSGAAYYPTYNTGFPFIKK